MDFRGARKGRPFANARPGGLTPRVAFYTDARSQGGAERILLTILERIERSRWDPILIYHPHPGIRGLVGDAAAADVRAVPLPWANSRGGRVLTLVPRLAVVLRRERPAILHVNMAWPLACRYGLIASALAGVPHVITTQHSFMRVSPRAARLQRLASAHVERMIAVSKYVADGMRTQLHLPAARIRIIHNGICARHFERQQPARPRVPSRTVLTVARLDEGKGHEYLIRAATRLPDARFVLAGDGPLRARLESLAEQLGVADRIVFLGERSDIPGLLAECDVVALASLNEGLPLSVLEAMAAERPVVAADVGGLREVISHGETGLLVPPADPTALAQAIGSLLDHPEAAAALAGAGHQHVKTSFTATRMVNQVMDVYSDVLAL